MIKKTINPTILEHWEGSWGTVSEGLLKMLQNQPDINVIDALDILDRWTENDTNFANLNNKITNQKNLPRDADGKPLFNLVAYNGKYKTASRTVKHSHFVSNVIKDYISEGTEYLVELGSGWGENLFRIYTETLDNKNFKDLKYIACEITQSGRKATDQLSKMVPKMDCSIHHFDYFNPDLSFLNPSSNIVYFSSHSIEQVANLPANPFPEMLKNSNECTCVHIEPVGWQRFKNLITDDITVIAGNVDPKEYIPLDPFFTRNAALLARTRDYNYNLLSLLDVLVNSGEIQIFEQNFDVFGINPFNPSTVISWKKNGLNK